MVDIFSPYKYLAISGDDSNRLDVVTSATTIAGFSAEMNKKLNTHLTIFWDYDETIDRDDVYGVSGEILPYVG